jgi:sec-independent protein translocase protein TatA
MLAEIVGPDMLILLVIAMVLFGGSRIPQLARSLGSAQREFKRGLSAEPEADANTDVPDVARNIGSGLRTLRNAHDDIRSHLSATLDTNTNTAPPPVASIEAPAHEGTAAPEQDPTHGASFL